MKSKRAVPNACLMALCAGPSGYLNTSGSVSYTHLDVYKRQPLDREVFRLYYTSECEDQQTIDIYFEDNSEPAQLYQLTFDFNNETEDEDSVVTADSKELPVTIVGH